MENEETNLNTESNDIAGNRINGPIGNTAARPTRPGTGTGLPGGPPTQSAAGSPDGGQPVAPASSEDLAESETSVGAGAVDVENDEQENKEANPDDLRPTENYGGNFGNSTQGSYNDRERRENQDSDPSRGEFGAQDLGGTTHGGYGNQNRLASYEPHGTAEDRYYGGAGRPGPQDNSYRAYDGGNERTDSRTDYGFEPGTPIANTSGRAADAGQRQGTDFDGPNGDNRNQPDRADANSAFQVDNGSAPTVDRGYADDYGHTSLRREAPGTGGATTTQGNQEAVSEHRNQTEDYRPSQSGADKQGHREEQHPGYSTNDPELADQRGQRPASSMGYADRGREEPRRNPDFGTGDDRTGYVQGRGGDTSQGLGSKGGSYNDAYDDSQPGSKAGSPAQGDQRTEDRAQNYGQAARQENRSAEGDDNAADHGAPRRNAGRDGEADE
ncbi:hypothetical protein I2I05_02720 [Hymenobacter sp. BT683]|uniref:Uncharacterized protein n=1 Tax=Hymenobacter jeongseonensis TaxID=2791027 RepID=A0ABS0IEM3_9BACT|nr:hypothetical protein [Hymenobacter jeongseonensis]MBF9236300.1 hypothetical protein [Hymenobacter jeongseonensis]